MPFRSTPAVSVITPAFNVEGFVGACIASVLQQSFDDFELLLVNDGSTDGTAQVIEAYAALDDRVRVIRTRNGGVSRARNLALAEARGALFAFIDADDLWDPAFLGEQIRLLDRHPEADVVTGNAVNAGSSRDGRPVRAWPAAVRELSLLDMITHEDAVFIMSVLRRRVYEAIGGFDEGLHHGEDWDFWLRAAVAGHRFIANPAPLGRYRRRDDSASANERAMLAGAIEVLGRTADRCGVERAGERAAIEARIRGFRSHALFCSGKAALVDGRFADAASCFRDRWRLQPTVGAALLAAGGTLTPRAMRAAYRAKRAWTSARTLHARSVRGLERAIRRERVSTNG